MSRQAIEVENDETHLTRKLGTKVKTKKPAYREGGVNDTTHRTRKPKATTKGYQAMPELDANSNNRKRRRQNQAKVKFQWNQLNEENNHEREKTKQFKQL